MEKIEYLAFTKFSVLDVLSPTGIYRKLVKFIKFLHPRFQLLRNGRPRLNVVVHLRERRLKPKTTDKKLCKYTIHFG